MSYNWFKKIIVKKSRQEKTLYILRGLPGSGKSTLAKQLAGETGIICSADDFFVDEKGKYNWDPSKISEAHRWNHARIKDSISVGISPVIIDNTHVTQWELQQLKPLVEYAENHGYDVQIKEPTTPWAFNAEELAKRNTHGVPLDSITSKLERWHHNPTVEEIKNNFIPPTEKGGIT